MEATSSDRWESRRCEATTHPSNNDSGYARITHPFHPLEDQCFEVLKTRDYGGEQTLILRRPPHGTYAVPAEWTDWSLPPSRSDLLELDRLIAVALLVKDLSARQKQSSGSGKKEVDA